MSEAERLELTLEIENLKEFKEAIDRFRPMLKNDLYTGFQRVAAKEDRILKGTTGFQDRTGHLRRTLYVLATFRPLGLEIGALAKYAYWVAMGHGTWKGNWWNTYLREMAPRVADALSKILDRIVKKYNRLFGGR